MSDSSHCDWYGIMCDREGHVIEINLDNNNVTGEFPARYLMLFYKLRRLNLAENNLAGSLYSTRWNSEKRHQPDISTFFHLRELTHVYLSHNKLSGEVDVLLTPALVEVDFSYNNFTSVISFMKFKPSHATLRKCDLSHNAIQEKASKLMKNLPSNMKELILSDNQIYGTFPDTLEELSSLKHLDISANMLSGGLPDFSRVYPNLQVLNLSNQKKGEGIGLTGTIPAGLSEFKFLDTFNLGGNSLTGTVPPVLGNMGLLKTLDLSKNLLSERIPPNLGNLEGKLQVLRFQHIQL